MYLELPYGTERIGLNVEEERVLLSATPRFPPSIGGRDEVAGAVWRALENPVESPPFSQLVRPGSKVAILVDNFARATPAHLILPPVLRFLAERKAEPVIIIASGALWEMTAAQLEAKLGSEVLASGIRIIQNRAREPEHYEFVGLTHLGTPLWIHKEFVSADVRLGVGLTQVNLWGYGGGGKIVLPGVCSYETIEWNHRLTTAAASSFGVDPAENPIRQDIEDAAERAGLSMVVNVILNDAGEVMHVAAGRARAVHRLSVDAYNAIYAFDVAEPADISLAGSFPWDVLFAHACWGAVGLDRVTRDGGTMILAAPCPAGIGHVSPIKKYLPARPEGLAEALRDFYYHRAEFWDGVIWYKLLEVLVRKHLIVVTEEKNLAGFADLGLEATTSLLEAYHRALERVGPDAKVAHVPFAKWCVPRPA